MAMGEHQLRRPHAGGRISMRGNVLAARLFVRNGQMNRLALTSGLAALSVSACAHYEPKAPPLAQFPTTFEARQLDEKPPGAMWTGAELLSAALARNPQVAEARAKYDVAVAAAETAKHAPGLTLTLTAEYADERPHWGGGAAADIPLDVGARRGVRLTAGDLQALQAWYSYGEAAWTVRQALETARIDLQGARAEVALAERLVSLRGERLRRLERRVEAGEDDRAPALAAQTELSTAERRLADARGREEQATVALAKALGVGSARARGTILAPIADPPDLDGLATWRRDAALSRSDVLRAMADYDLAESALRLEIAKQYPEVRIGPGYTYDHGVNKLPFNLSLALPGYDLNRHAIAQAEAVRTAAGRSLELAQANALAAIDTATSALTTGRANLERVVTRERPSARRAAENTARALREGEADRVEDLAAKAAALDAELNLLEAQRAVRTAVANLEDSLRRPFDPAQRAVLQAALSRAGHAR